ncbi:MAG: hypothetical protein HKN65_12775 [Woeseiaceae bacterium]|nr:hypothetical protein [Gammaproteobacteria bacterium]NNF50724.1 hypothetical protein [Woeseiaceae bacterium]NNK26573.1 hypothetical protein [Woeseiaceae bacterium]
MTFHEKSAWIMAFALSIGGLFYAVTVLSMSSGLGALAPPLIPTVVIYTVILVVLAIIGHIVAVAFAPEDADEATDERERRIIDRSGHLSAYVLGAGVLFALGLYLWSYNGNLMFYALFASLMLSQLFEYVVQIALHRRGVY